MEKLFGAKNKNISKTTTILLLVFAVLIALILLFLFKFKIYVVASDSMYPNLQKDEIVIVQKGGKINTGDIITFNSFMGEITHRVVDIKIVDEICYYICFGDNNQLLDLSGKAVDKSEIENYIKNANLDELKLLNFDIVTKDLVVGKVILHFKGFALLKSGNIIKFLLGTACVVLLVRHLLKFKSNTRLNAYLNGGN